jgi:hypothetical protein
MCTGCEKKTTDNLTDDHGSGIHDQQIIKSNPLKNAYFGETHLHTAFSLDAYLGGTRLHPSDAYRFAKGETVEVNGEMITISKPLDFCAVTDHAEYLGEMYANANPGSPGYDNEKLAELRGLSDYKVREEWFFKYVVSVNRGDKPRHTSFYPGEDAVRNGWKVIIKAAEDHYIPGQFTTIPAFEWSAAPGGGNLHRNIFFRDMNLPDIVPGYADINREEELWEWMKQLEDKGINVIAAPHNSNASKGMMFSSKDSKGDPIDLEYATMRNRFEPLIEMMQIKGNSEVHAKFWTNDEFADYENANSIQEYSGRIFSKQDFVRFGLVKGLEYEKDIGVNPYQFGFIGGTDNHNGTPSNLAESNFKIGSHGSADGSIERRRTGEVGGWIKGVDLTPGALTGVWAKSNTREEIWDAMKKKEVFATSGTRLKVRFFGGFGLSGDPENYEALVEEGYDKGVPMGQSLEKGEGSPTFYVWAMKDPDQANLDRIQVIKGWLSPKGEIKEKIYNVTWSGDRKPDSMGKLAPVGNTVNLENATYTNTIGSSMLMTSWKDPDFEPSLHATYYARVLEIPTPRWSTYDAVRAGLPLLKDVKKTIQERAWSSPIWYSPYIK